MKKKLREMGSELSEKIGQLKMLSTDGKHYKSPVNAKTKELLDKSNRNNPELD